MGPRFHPQVLLGFYSENFYPVFNPNIEHIIFWPCLDPLHNVENNHNPVFNPNHYVQKIFCTKGPNIFTWEVIHWNLETWRLQIRLNPHIRNLLGKLSLKSIAQKMDLSKGKQNFLFIKGILYTKVYNCSPRKSCLTSLTLIYLA